MDERYAHPLKTLGRLCLPFGLLAALLLDPVYAGGGSLLAPTMNGDQYDDLAIGHPGEDSWYNGQKDNAGAVSVIYGSNNRLQPPGSQTWHQGWTPENTPGTDNLFGNALAIGDFDGDSFNDLAVGIPGEDVDGKNRAGAVHVFYGGNGGLTTTGDQFWHQGLAAVGGTAKDHNAYGSVLAAADFNGDSYDDLAVGIPSYDVGPGQDYGAVNVLYGTAGGLTATRNQLWFQGTTSGLADVPEEGDRFGHALAVGDFDCNGYADLAIGVPEEDVETWTSVPDAGVVHILYGTAGGLSNAGDQLWHQNALGVVSADDDLFGYSLVGGDFNGDGCTDLAVGAPGEAVHGPNCGAVDIIYSDGDGLSAAGAHFWTQDTLEAADGGAEMGDQFGYALAAGDFDGQGGTDDLAVGAPFEDVGSVERAGAVSVLYGSGTGLSGEIGDQYFRQPLSSPGSVPEDSDNFGRALAAGDFDANGAADLAIGVPYDDFDDTTDSGVVHILYGSPGRQLSTALGQEWNEGFLATSMVPQDGDRFGYALAASPPPRPGPIQAYEVYVPLLLREYSP